MRFLPLLLLVFLCYCCLAGDYKINQPSERIPVKTQTVSEYEQAKAELERNNPDLLKQYKKATSQRICGSDALQEYITQKQQEQKDYLNSLFPFTWLQDQFTSKSEIAQTTCPTKTQCDNPSIRDLYSDTSVVKRMTVEFVIERGTSLANNADTLIPTVLTELNNAYASAGIQFVGETVLWGPLLSNSGTPVGTWYTNFECDPSDSQPCYDHVSIANDVFNSRGGFKKNNTVVLFVANIQGGGILGFAYFPWLPNNGLVVVIPSTISFGDTTVRHEIGHSLGLWHTHRGSSEVFGQGQCPLDSTCYEGVASDTTGDFCDDTGPFPNPIGAGITTCRAPTVAEVPDPCNPQRTAWSTLNTVNNYMSYTLDSCQNTFTTKQARRMRCYIERIGYPAAASALFSSVSILLMVMIVILL